MKRTKYTHQFNDSANKKSLSDSSGPWEVELIAECGDHHEIIKVFQKESEAI